MIPFTIARKKPDPDITRQCIMNTFEEFISEKVRLPSPPAVAIKILQAIRKEDNSFEELADIIGTDPALAVKVLKIANSSLYGAVGKIDSLQKATALIGTNALRNIALSFVIVDRFQDSPQESFDMEHFWRRAVTAAVAADVLSKKMNHVDDEIFITSLLQDIGVIILFLQDPATYSEMRDNKRLKQESTSSAETQYFGVNHCEVGSYLLKQWCLPESISLPILYHHSDTIPEENRKTAHILRLSGTISGIFTGIQSNSKTIDVHHELSNLLSWSTEEIIETLDIIGDKSREMLTLFEIDPGDTMPISHIMQDVIDELGRLNLSYEQVVFELRQAKQNAEQLARELKQANDSLRELAYRDGLTGLYNHRYFQEALLTELDRSKRYKSNLSLLLIDIDHFKSINDTYGHLIGDKVLTSIGQQLIKLVRKSDLVARYGGEEFAIILPEANKQSGKILAQRVRRGIEQHTIQTEDHSINITISVGLISTDIIDDSDHQSHFVSLADQALYRAKEMGRNRVELWND